MQSRCSQNAQKIAHERKQNKIKFKKKNTHSESKLYTNAVHSRFSSFVYLFHMKFRF